MMTSNPSPLRVFTLCLFSLAFTGLAMAEVKLPGFFGDHMVLQRDRAVPVWGWADKGEKVAVAFGGQTLSATADDDGKWRVELSAMKANASPRDLVIGGGKTITITNVVVGDVWICSGQSNMEWTQSRSVDAKKEAEAANYPLIRHIKFGHEVSRVPTDDNRGKWDVCTPKSVGNFTAVGYYFARKLHADLNVPIGLIGSNWGGTKVEPWIAGTALGQVPELKKYQEEMEKKDPATDAGKAYYKKQLEQVTKWLSEAEKNVAAGKQMPGLPRIDTGNVGSGNPSAIYNRMIHPIVGYGIKGAIWYQGESNGGEGESYFHKKKALITGWRELWGYDFPFYFVQLANYSGANDNPAGGDGFAKIREAQRQTLTVPKTGMAVIIDVGNARNIHPPNKQDVGKRLALWALAKDFGKDVVHSGPLFREMKIEGANIRLSFDHVGSGLMAAKKEKAEDLNPPKPVDKLKRFAIAGEDKKWVWAEAVIDGATIVVSSLDVAAPVAVRYAYSGNPEGCNLYNKEGLPASPFRTDDW